jgi:serine protease Do
MTLRSFACALCFLLSGCYSEPGKATPATLQVAPSLAASSAAPVLGYPDFTQLVEAEGSKVVHVMAVQKPNLSEKETGAMLDLLRKFMPGPEDPDNQPPSPERLLKPPVAGIGSGFFISADGYLLTNAHVVDKADVVTIKTLGRKQYKAKVVGLDVRTDVALLKVEGGPFPFVRTANTEKLKVGSWVAAIGSPFGFDNSVTAGIVSAKGRFLPDDNYLSFIQTDVAINPGNSGGPLFNLSGEVVGINTQIYSRTGGFMGMSFSIPIDSALKVAEQLKATGKVRRSRIGIRIQPMSEDMGRALGIDVDQGVLVGMVEPGSPAQKGGLRAGDVVSAVDNVVIDEPGLLTRIAAESPAGKVLVLKVLRGKRTISLPITVVDAATADATKANKVSPSPTAPKANAWGLAFVGNSLVVDSVTGVAAKSGLAKGDCILGAQQTLLDDRSALDAWISSHNSLKTVAILVKRGDSNIFVILELDAEK